MARVVVVGLGPAGPELVTTETRETIERIRPAYLRTTRHPAASMVHHAASFDEIYETAASFDDVYRLIADELVAAALHHGEVLYAVPGSPRVLERSVDHFWEQFKHSIETGNGLLIASTLIQVLSLLNPRFGVCVRPCELRQIIQASTHEIRRSLFRQARRCNRNNLVPFVPVVAIGHLLPLSEIFPSASRRSLIREFTALAISLRISRPCRDPSSTLDLSSDSSDPATPFVSSSISTRRLLT